MLRVGLVAEIVWLTESYRNGARTLQSTGNDRIPDAQTREGRLHAQTLVLGGPGRGLCPLLTNGWVSGKGPLFPDTAHRHLLGAECIHVVLTGRDLCVYVTRRPYLLGTLVKWQRLGPVFATATH